MKCNMKVTITDPATPKGMTSAITFDLDCNFYCDEKDYGNGYYVSIECKGGFKNYYDIRYDRTFDRRNKVEWLERWARNYWSGKDGAWKIKDLQITHA